MRLQAVLHAKSTQMFVRFSCAKTRHSSRGKSSCKPRWLYLLLRTITLIAYHLMMIETESWERFGVNSIIIMHSFFQSYTSKAREPLLFTADVYSHLVPWFTIRACSTTCIPTIPTIPSFWLLVHLANSTDCSPALSRLLILSNTGSTRIKSLNSSW